jgi:hypothetical protein
MAIEFIKNGRVFLTTKVRTGLKHTDEEHKKSVIY